MHASRSITVLCLAMALPMAHGEESAHIQEAKSAKKIPAISLLPDGSELEDVVMPRYDKDLRLTGSLLAGKLTLISPELIDGDDVHIKLIDPNHPETPTRITMGTGVLDQVRGIVRGKDNITIKSARFTATGSALHFIFEDGHGFVSGPATTVIFAPQKTAMFTPATSRHPILATAALGVAVAASAIVQARPPAISEEELSALHQDAASRADEIRTYSNQTRADVSETSDLSEELSETARTFLINQVLESGQEPPGASNRGEDKPLEIEASPEDTQILSDGGFYFDAEEGILVYLKNVRVTDPRYTLDGADELKIIFEKKPEKKDGEAKPDKEGLGAGFASGIGDAERIIATGRVRFNQRQTEPGKPPIEASGALLNYNVTTGDIIISGGYPWVRQGGYYARALQPNLSLRIRGDGSFVTEGNWDSGQKAPR